MKSAILFCRDKNIEGKLTCPDFISKILNGENMHILEEKYNYDVCNVLKFIKSKAWNGLV